MLVPSRSFTAAMTRPMSFMLAALACALAIMCYAEFASTIPVAGSAYTYSYVVLGEVIAWVIGWSLILEYSLVVSTVAVGWSGYASALLTPLGFPVALTNGPELHGIVNLPAVFIIAVFTSAGARSGFASSSSAAAPATCGAAIDVPDMEPWPPLSSGSVDQIEPPGAATSGLRSRSAVRP